MRRFALLLLLAFLAPAAEAEAADRVRLLALGPHAEIALLAYDSDWVEVSLKSGETRALTPPPTCGWAGAAFDPSAGGYALLAHCVPELNCVTRRAALYRTDASGRLVHVATAEGRRWRAPLWRAEGGAVIVVETALSPPETRGLADLSTRSDCAEGPARLVELRVADGRRVALDFLPRGAEAEAPLGAANGRLVARLRLKRGPALLEWDGEGWRPFAEADAAEGRVLLSADLATVARERCVAAREGRSGRAECAVEISGPSGDRRIEAERALRSRLFGEIALSADGGSLGALLARPGLAPRRFTIHDVAGGPDRDLSDLLALSAPWGEPR